MNQPSHDLLRELESDTLAAAVMAVTQQPVPQGAVQECVNRLMESAGSTPPADGPQNPRRHRFRTWFKAGFVCLSTAAAILMLGYYVQQSREEARQVAMANSLKQVGLAVHNYVDQNGDLYAGSRLSYALQPPGSVTMTTESRFGKSMIIYSSSVALIVTDLEAVDKRVRELVEQFEGRVGDSSFSEPQGAARSATWTIRIPTEKLDEFVNETCRLGTPENRTTNSDDVTEEYADLQAQIRNKQKLEERFLKLLEERTGSLKDVLEVENQLARVREEIERMQGRVTYIDEVTAMTIVQISDREERNYVPPQAPTLSTEIGQTWDDSVRGLSDLGSLTVLGVVAALPWLPLVGLLFAGFTWGRRRMRRGKSA